MFENYSFSHSCTIHTHTALIKKSSNRRLTPLTPYQPHPHQIKKQQQTNKLNGDNVFIYTGPPKVGKKEGGGGRYDNKANSKSNITRLYMQKNSVKFSLKSGSTVG